MSGVLYTDHDERACAWLRELVSAGHLPQGEVWCRDIQTIKPEEVSRFHQRHWFCGVGFWALALMWAKWPKDRPVDTASCPCQPFSCAGSGKGTKDERHLWPCFYKLVRSLRPSIVFGEQVASAAVVGKVGRGVAAPAVPVWLDGVRADLETEGYAFGAAVLGAHSVGAPHIRQRVYWVADGGTYYAAGSRRDGQELGAERDSRNETRLRVSDEGVGTCRPSISACGGQRADGSAPRTTGHADEREQVGGSSDDSGTGLAGRQEQPAREECQAAERSGDVGGTQHPTLPEGTRFGQLGIDLRGPASGIGWTRDAASDDQQRDWQSGQGVRRQEQIGGSMPWSDSIIHRYLDGKDRRIPSEPRLFPLADDRHPYHRGRVGLLRGAGNAIVPAAAKEFIEACEEVLNGEAP